jgi:hypothetical protein
VPSIAHDKTDPIFAAIEAHRDAWNASQKAFGTIPDVVVLMRDGVDDARAEAMVAAALQAIDPICDIEHSALWDLVWTVPTTASGLAALLRYCREHETINELVEGDDKLANILEWTLESAACAQAGLPEPPMSDIVAAAWESRTDDESELETA